MPDIISFIPTIGDPDDSIRVNVMKDFFTWSVIHQDHVLMADN